MELILLLVIRSVSDVLQAQSRFVKSVCVCVLGGGGGCTVCIYLRGRLALDKGHGDFKYCGER